MADVIADNQTEAVLAQLDRGETDAKLHSSVLAALLRALTKLTDQLDGIKRDLWRPSDLETAIDSRHRVLCAECPLRRVDLDREAAKPKAGWLATLASNPALQFFLMGVILIWALVYATGGRGAVEAVREATASTATGGLAR